MEDSEINHVYKTKEGQEAYELFKSMSKKILPIPVLEREYKKAQENDYEKLEVELAEVKVAYAAISENIQKLQKENEHLKKIVHEKTKHIEVTSRKKADIEKQYELLTKCKISPHNEELLEQTKLRYKALRNMTQVRFVFKNSLDDSLEGCVINNVTKKIKGFSIQNLPHMTNEQISDKIRSTMENVADINRNELLKQM